MTIQIGKVVVGGGVYCSRRNGVLVLLDFGGDIGIRLELAGNPSVELAGRRVEFTTADRPADAEEFRAAADALEFFQIGVVGAIDLRNVAGRPCLHVEWFGQNGHIVAEILDPVITDQSVAAKSDDDPAGASRDDEDEANLPLVDESGDDPYQLFPADLPTHLLQAGFAAEDAEQVVPPAADERPQRRSWDEVIPGLDPETKRMYDEWDEIVDGAKDEPLVMQFDPPISLKKPAAITTEAEAETALRTLLASLALHSVAIDICEHFEPLATYRWLLEEILPKAQIHPRLGKTGFVKHYCTYESCKQCNEDFEANE
ncbi:hypothetical protein NA78x_003249 [Anatilimnocola sp. NA78]|uniref:hypothetical protein n=1 Tax=Anatilimnocola sp. NA78 TaxID=3415683 RepID=UPI003CE53BFA